MVFSAPLIRRHDPLEWELRGEPCSTLPGTPSFALIRGKQHRHTEGFPLVGRFWGHRIVRAARCLGATQGSCQPEAVGNSLCSHE